MTISVRLNERETELFKSYAALKNISLSELIRSSVLEKIEDEIDLKCYEEAMEEFKKDPTVYTLEDVEKELGLI